MSKYLTVPPDNTTLSVLPLYTQKLIDILMKLIPNNLYLIDDGYFILKLNIFYESSNVLTLVLIFKESLHYEDIEYYMDYAMGTTIDFVVQLSADNIPTPSENNYIIRIENGSINILNKNSMNVTDLINDIQHSPVKLIEFEYIG